MSLLDDVSIVVTPNGYKAGELYAVVPVPTEGAELVVNGDFATDTDWTKGTGWTISGGTANCDGSQSGNTDLTQSIATSIGKQYKITYTVSNYSAGSIKIRLNSGNVSLSKSSNGTFAEVLSGQGGGFSLRADLDFIGSIDNVSVKEYTSADMDVTRATAATRVDENGLVNYAEIIGDEEVVNGDFDTDTDWTKGAGWTISGGNLNASNVNAVSTTQAGYTFVGKTFQVSYTISDYSQGSVQIYLGGSQSTSLKSENGTHTETISISSGNATLYIYGTSNFTGNIDNVSVKEVTRDNVPRIDYTGGGCPHILSEPQRTNLITYSSDFSQSYWIKQSNITPTYNTTETLSPDGTYNATKLVGNGTDGIYKASISITGVAARSVYLKSVTGTVNVILKDPNLTVTSPTLDVTTEWQRFELTADNGSGGQGIWVDDIPASGIYIWGAQVEESYPTSYIPTSGSTVTRNRDIFTRDGIGSLINSPEGVLFAEMAAFSNDGTNRKIALSDGTGNNLVRFYFSNSSNRVVAQVKVGGSTQVTFDITGITVTNFNKVALKYKENDFAIWINGVERGTDISGTTPSSMNKIAFDNGAGSDYFYGKVKQLQVYKTADIDLAALTS